MFSDDLLLPLRKKAVLIAPPVPTRAVADVSATARNAEQAEQHWLAVI